MQTSYRFLKKAMQVGQALDGLIRCNPHYVCELAMPLHYQRNWVIRAEGAQAEHGPGTAGDPV